MSAMKRYFGQSSGKAMNKLLRDIIWHQLEQHGKTSCYRCNEPMARETFSIDHVKPWRRDHVDSEALFFDMDNIEFSHSRCNSQVSYDERRHPCGTPAAYYRGCRCEDCTVSAAYDRQGKKTYDPEKRREQYERHGR
jgi:hypothetical protein